MIAEYIKNGIDKLYAEGLTQQEIAEKAGISGNTIISQLLSKKKDANNLRLSVAEKLISIIPEIQIIIGDKLQGKTTSSNYNSDKPSYQKDAQSLEVIESPSVYKSKIAQLEKLIMASNEFDSETKVKLYQMIQDL